MYEAYFKFNIKPFDLLPNPEFIYLSKTHKKALTYLDYGIREKAGFVLLSGEIGAGKTTLIRELLTKCSENITIAKVFNTRVSSDQLLAMINDDFGLDIRGKDKVQLLRDLYDFLIRQYSQGKHSLLIIDESQNLSSELLEEVRMLSNLETDNAKLLQIILAGQPELKRMLAVPELEQLRQRISVACHIAPLTRIETEEYILHRLEVAGNRNAIVFTAEALDMIYHYSRGIPRLINVICDFLMLSAFVEEKSEIDAELVAEIAGDLELDVRDAAILSSQVLQLNKDDVVRDLINPDMEYEMRKMITDLNQRVEKLEQKHYPGGQKEVQELKNRLGKLDQYVKDYAAKLEATILEQRTQLKELHVKTASKSNVHPGQEVKRKGIFRTLLGMS